jgi:acyl transferase domain-containing protein
MFSICKAQASPWIPLALLAVHLACEALNSGDASLALAGGVNVMLNPNLGIAFTQAGLLSPDGSCKPFDDRANGYVRGEGVGVVMLQRLSDALADQREIYAVIRGSAVVQDGRSSGLMAPRGPAQESAIRQACARAGVAPAEIAFVEAHGTGTALGDVIEAQALGATVGAGREAGPCLIGSVKSNIGHLESAAGIAGLIKAALSLRNGCWLGNRNYEQPNRRLDLPELGLEVVSDLLPWSDKAARRLASVSSFGFGGTNVHAVLESAEQTVFEREDTSPEPILLAISAPDSLGLERTIALALNQFEHEKDPVRALNWIASSARRTPSKLRLAIVGSNPAEVVRQLREASKRSNERALAAGGLGLVFNGQGSLWQGAGRDLFATSIIYRDSLMEVDASLKAQGLESVLLTLFADDADQRAAKTELAQPAIFASQVALTCLLRSWGAVPAAVAGHSVGEVAAAWAAGCVTLDVAARIVAARSQAMIETRGGGGMVLLSCSNERCIELIVGIPGVTIAAINGPSSSVISGDQTALNEAVARAGRAGVVTRHLNVVLRQQFPFSRRWMVRCARIRWIRNIGRAMCCNQCASHLPPKL